MKEKILVLGGTGKTGKRVVERLTRLGKPVRIGSRQADPKFDWEDQSTWADTLRDVSGVYVTFQPDLAVPGAAAAIQSFVDLAVRSGVQKLVLLSGRGEKEAEQCEEIVRSSGVEWTLVRASWFSQNFSESYWLDAILAGDVALPTNGVAEPFVDADDIADVVTAALLDDKHNGRMYELTGPRLLTFSDAVGEIAEACQVPVRYREVSVSEYVEMLKAYNTPVEYIGLLKYLFSEILDGRNASVCDGVVQAVGRKASDFSEYVQKARATGVWSNVASVK